MAQDQQAKEPLSLAKKTFSGVIWHSAEQFGRRGIEIIGTLALAALLRPEDFGLLGMIAVFIALANGFAELGLMQALIRERIVEPGVYNAVFAVNIVIGVAAYAVLYFAAPLIAAFFDQPQLIRVVRAIGIVVILNSFQLVPSAILARQLRFGDKAKATVPAVILSAGTAIVLASLGFGIWALVAQALISALLITIFLWIASGWVPSLHLDISDSARLLSFGHKVFLSGAIETVFRNLYVVVIAKGFSALAAGHYFLADRIRNLVVHQVVNAVQTATYPAIATLQHDERRLRDAYRKLIRITTFLIFPTLGFIILCAEPLFEIILPGSWRQSSHYLQLLCLASVLYPMHSINLNLLKVLGRSDILLRLQVLKKLLLVIALTIGMQYGIYGILCANIVQSVLSYLPNQYYSEKFLGYTTRNQIIDFLPQLVLASLIGIIGLLLNKMTEPGTLLTVVASFLGMAVIYPILASLLHIRAASVTWETLKNAGPRFAR
jgi:O-antigen/teichoic acid export membrane protein